MKRKINLWQFLLPIEVFYRSRQFAASQNADLKPIIEQINAFRSEQSNARAMIVRMLESAFRMRGRVKIIK